MSNDTIIIVEEEVAPGKADEGASGWTEEISVRGAELMDAVGRLARGAGVRKITVKNAAGKTLVEFPLVLGVAGVLVIGPWTAALLAAAWLTRLSILIEYAELPDRLNETAEEIEIVAA